jgi:hypothetical protein
MSVVVFEGEEYIFGRRRNNLISIPPADKMDGCEQNN